MGTEDWSEVENEKPTHEETIVVVVEGARELAWYDMDNKQFITLAGIVVNAQYWLDIPDAP